MVFNDLQWPIEHAKSFGTSCRIMVGLSGNGPSQIWLSPPTWPTRTFLMNSTRFGGVKGLIVTRSIIS